MSVERLLSSQYGVAADIRKRRLAGSPLHDGCVGRVDVALGAGIHERACRRVQVFRHRFGIRIGRVHKDSDHLGFRNKLVQ